jgi:hypothetical protein
VNHDPRSRNFATARGTGVRDRVRHKRHGKTLDQGRYWDPGTKSFISLGSCTGNALVGAISCEPLHRRYEHTNENLAVKLYSRASQIDPWEGGYPPTDTGSDGLSVCKAGVEFGLLTRYEHAFSIIDALDALQVQPVITGVEWREGADRPDANGLVHPLEGEVRGGHEFCVDEFIPAITPLDSLIGCQQSWGPNWGKRGRFYMTIRDWGTLLEADGDCTVPIRG